MPARIDLPSEIDPRNPRCRHTCSSLTREAQGIDFGDERFFRAVHVQTAGHLTGSEEQGGCKSLERLHVIKTRGDSSRVRIRARHAWDPGANPGHRSKLVSSPESGVRNREREGIYFCSFAALKGVSLSAPHSGGRVRIPGAAPTLRSKVDGTPHKGNRGGSIPPVATNIEIPECSNSRIRGFDPLGWGCKSLLRS